MCFLLCPVCCYFFQFDFYYLCYMSWQESAHLHSLIRPLSFSCSSLFQKSLESKGEGFSFDLFASHGWWNGCYSLNLYKCSIWLLASRFGNCKIRFSLSGSLIFFCQVSDLTFKSSICLVLTWAMHKAFSAAQRKQEHGSLQPCRKENHRSWSELV